EVVEPLSAEAEGRDHLSSLTLLVYTRDDTSLDQFDCAIGKEFGVDAEIAVAAQKRQYGVRYGTDSGLERGTVGDALSDKCTYSKIERTRLFRRDLDECAIGHAPPRYLRQV